MRQTSLADILFRIHELRNTVQGYINTGRADLAGDTARYLVGVVVRNEVTMEEMLAHYKQMMEMYERCLPPIKSYIDRQALTAIDKQALTATGREPTLPEIQTLPPVRTK